MHTLDTHASLLLQIGRVNAACGVQSHHYPYFEVALIQTLGQILGDALTEPLKQAWIAVFGTMTRLMLAGATSTGVSRTTWVATVATTAAVGQRATSASTAASFCSPVCKILLARMAYSPREI